MYTKFTPLTFHYLTFPPFLNVYLEVKVREFASSSVMDNCMPNPCQNGGSCYEEGMDYTCTCSGNWFGQRCTDRKFDDINI